MTDWIQRWQHNQIGWHRDNFNQRMQKFLPNLELSAGDTIFVPLCGKSLDMIYLKNQGYNVIGVELSTIAITDFFTEHDIAYTTENIDNFVVYTSEHITIYEGNIFNLQKHHLSSINAIYDRASLVALNPQLRKEYSLLFDGIISSDVAYLLLTLDYNQDEISGPPFAVSQAEILEIFSHWNVTQLESFNDITNEAKFRDNGLTILNKESYILRKH